MPLQVDNIYALLAVLIVTIVPTVPAILAFIQARRAATKVNETHLAVMDVARATNGMTDHLVEATRQAALAAGLAEGKAVERARADAETLIKLRRSEGTE